MEPCVVVTGGSNGIGSACVELLSRAGRQVVNLDRRPPAPAADARFIEVDLCDARSIQRAFESVLAGGEIVGLVNNAGMSLSRSLANLRLFLSISP